MDSSNIEYNLQLIKRSTQNPSDDVSKKTIVAINHFENDPSILKPYLNEYISNINQSFISTICTSNSQLSRIHFIQSIFFYNLTKICSSKIVNKYLLTDISYLNPILLLLQEDIPWETLFFLLSWCQIVILSPFNIPNDKYIWQLTYGFKSNQVLNHIVTQIHAILYQKNYDLFCEKIDTELLHNNDLETLNYYLKTQLIESTNNNLIHGSNDNLNKITQLCLHMNVKDSENSQLLILKILPKLFLLQSWKENWSIVTDLIDWYFKHLDSNYTEVRFMLAHSYGKLLKRMINDFDGEIEAIRCIEEIIHSILTLIASTPMDIIDMNTLHSYLLIIAECSKIIIKSLPHMLLVITGEILPFAYRFQQLHIGNVIKGSQIKDAANFIVWSCSRYSSLPNSVICDLLKFLLPTTLFDRDFLIRKSSNATLQELLGRHGGSILNNVTTMSLIQLPIHSLHESYARNLKNLYEIFKEDRSPHSQNIFNHIIKWVFEQNIMINFDLDIVILSVDTLCQFHRQFPDYPIKEMIQEYMNYNAITNQLAYNKLLYLITEATILDDALDNIDPDSLVMNFELTQSRYYTSNKNDIFKLLSYLKYYHYKLLKNTVKFFTSDKISLFYRVVEDITEDSPWFDSFKLVTNNIIEILSKHADMYFFPDKDTFDDFWYKYAKFLKYNKPLICSSLPFLPRIKFLKYLHMYKEVLSCYSKSLLLSTLTQNMTALENFLQDKAYMDMIIEFLNDRTITEQGDVGRFTRESACQLVSKWYPQFCEHDIKERLIPTILYLAAEPSKNVKKQCINILTNFVEKYLSSKLFSHFTKSNSPNVKLFNLQLGLDNNSISRTFWRHYSTYAGALRSTEEDLMNGVDDFIGWYEQLTPDTQRKTLNDIIISIPSAQVIKEDKSLIKYTICGLKFVERVWCSRIACGYENFNWQGVYAKLFNITLLKNKQLFGAVLQILPALAIAWNNSNTIHKDYSYINTLIEFLVKTINKNKDNNIPKTDLTALQRNTIECLVSILLEFNEFERIIYVNVFIKNYKDTPFLDARELYL